ELEGWKFIKSVYGTYLRNVEAGYSNKVDFSLERDACLQWNIKPHGKQISFDPHCSYYRFLHANHDGSVNISQPYTDGKLTHSDVEEVWTASKNKEGSWTFRNHFGAFLSAGEDGAVQNVQGEIDPSGHFWLEDRPVRLQTLAEEARGNYY
ncbi:hypothetical protein PMAYCL1PPCAC_21360, partial [Pristionchus mayeri]